MPPLQYQNIGSARDDELGPARDRLRRQITLQGHKAFAKEFLNSPRGRTYFLEDPNQFMISWTDYKKHTNGTDELLGGQLAQELMSAEKATGYFWFRIGVFGTAFNLVRILRKVTDDRLPALKAQFGRLWQDRLDAAWLKRST
jgi:hypothetical protein